MPGFVLLVRPRGDGDPLKRIGITVSGKVGGAVVRNRMKRRFRELARAVLPEAGIVGADHVMIGRAQGIERDFALLRSDLIGALARLKKKADRPELVEGLAVPRSGGKTENRPSTSSGQTATPDGGVAP
jgi:ribonuclease P protein component